MGKRLKVALNYSYNESWIGGTYYIENLISALNTLDEQQKPIIYIISNIENYKNLKRRIKYPYLIYHKQYEDRSIFWRFLNRLITIFNSSFLDKLTTVDAIFPYFKNIPFLYSRKQIFWIPDFQEHYLPIFFSNDEINTRKEKQILIATSKRHLILSSNNAFEHFNEIYPDNQVNTCILPFAVTLPALNHVNFLNVKKEYQLYDEYFMCANQFWAHKDHKTLIEAIYHLKKKGIKKVVYLTGKTEDYRFPHYFQEITTLIQDYQLEKQIFILGFLEREIQLSILKNAKAIIQPSLFEGWSTVIEDAKALNKYIIASDTQIHQEQLKNYPNHSLFLKQNPINLSDNLLTDEIFVSNQMSYEDNIKIFAFSFLKNVK